MQFFVHIFEIHFVFCCCLPWYMKIKACLVIDEEIPIGIGNNMYQYLWYSIQSKRFRNDKLSWPTLSRNTVMNLAYILRCKVVKSFYLAIKKKSWCSQSEFEDRHNNASNFLTQLQIVSSLRKFYHHMSFLLNSIVNTLRKVYNGDGMQLGLINIISWL